MARSPRPPPTALCSSGHGRADRIGHRIGRGPLHSLSGDSGRQATVRFQGGLGRTECRNGRHQRSSASCVDSSARPIFFAIPRRSSACSSSRKKGTQPLRSRRSPSRQRLRRTGHALQAGPVRTSVGRRDRGTDGSARARSGAVGRCDAPERIGRIYQPAFGIIGDPAKRGTANTRQSARSFDGLLVATLLRRRFKSAGPVGRT